MRDNTLTNISFYGIKGLIVLLIMLITLYAVDISSAGEYRLPYGTHTIIITPMQKPEPKTSDEIKILDKTIQYGTITLIKIETIPTTTTTIIYDMKSGEIDKTDKKIRQDDNAITNIKDFVTNILLPLGVILLIFTPL